MSGRTRQVTPKTGQPQKSSLSPRIQPQNLQRQRESSRSLLANSCWKIAQKSRSVVFARAGRLLPEISRHRRRPGEPTSPNLEWPSYLPGLWVLIVITSLSSHRCHLIVEVIIVIFSPSYHCYLLSSPAELNPPDLATSLNTAFSVSKIEIHTKTKVDILVHPNSETQIQF